MLLTLNLGSRVLRASWWMAALTLAGVLLFAQLGRWQWHRAAEKRALGTAFVVGSQQIVQLDGHPTSALPRYLRVQVTGRYDGERQFLLDNMSHGGRVGYEVLTPLRLADSRLLIVNRGWLPLPQGRRDVAPDIRLAATGPQTLTGRLDTLPVAGLAAGDAPPEAGPAWPKRTSFPTAAQLGQALGAPVEARQLLLDDRAPYGFQRDWQPASAGFGPERHVSYAVQWWGFAGLALFLFVFLNLERR